MSIIQHLRKEQFTVSSWSGGTTTQLAIWPADAKYAERNFLWRISSATVDLEESVFTDLPDYQRLIATLNGSIEINHDGGERITLQPYEVHAFDGASKTCSWGKCVDFNLMIRKGACGGRMEAIRVAAGESIAIRVHSEETLFVYLPEGTGSIRGSSEEVPLAQFEAAQVCQYAGELVLTARSDCVFMTVVVA